MAENYTVINFDNKESESYFQISIDERSENITPVPGCAIYIRVISNQNYRLVSTCGKVVPDVKNLVAAVVGEEHKFTYTSESELSYIPDGNVYLEWECKQLIDKPTIDYKTIKFKKDVFGLLEAAYSYKYDRWVLYDVRFPTKIIVLALDNNDNALGELTIEYSGIEDSDDEQVEPETPCSVVKIEKISPTQLERGDTLEFQVIGKKPNSISACPNQSVAFVKYEEKTTTEEVTFTAGSASVQNPISNFVSITFFNCPGVPNNCTYNKGLTGLEKSSFKNDKTYYKIQASVTYKYFAYVYTTNTPLTYPSDVVLVEAFFDECDRITLEVPFETRPGLVDVTLHVKKEKDMTAIPNVTYRLYLPSGTISGTTDSLGRVTFTDLTPGDIHAIQLEKALFKNSWEDEIVENDNLEVPVSG